MVVLPLPVVPTMRISMLLSYEHIECGGSVGAFRSVYGSFSRALETLFSE